MGDYSYFRAEGASLTAVRTVEDAAAMIDTLSKNLAARYGARCFNAGSFGNGSFEFDSDAVPSTFKTAGSYTITASTDPNAVVSVPTSVAEPKTGTEDAEYVAGIMDLIKEECSRLKLEQVFGCSEMPDRHLLALAYSTAFVLENVDIEKANGGKINTECYYNFTATDAAVWQDSLKKERMMGSWYIRVPNDQDGNPLFTPPGGILMSYEDMLVLDRREYETRSGIKAPRRPYNPPRGPGIPCN